MRVHRGSVPWWDAHWARLARGARAPAHAVAGRRRRSRAKPLRCSPTRGDGVLKLIVTRGGGGRGYAPTADAHADVDAVAASAAAAAAREWARAALVRRRGWRSSRRWPGIKHCNRLEQVLARARMATTPAIDEGLMREQRGRRGLRDRRQPVRAARRPLVDAAGRSLRRRRRLPRHGCSPLLDAREARLSVDAMSKPPTRFSCAMRCAVSCRVARLGARTWPPHPAVAAAATRAGATRIPAFAAIGRGRAS